MVEAIFGRLLRVYDEKAMPAIELKVNLFEAGLRPEHPEHEEINKRFREKKEAQRSEAIRRFVGTFGDKGRFYIEGLKERVGVNLYWHLSEIMRYTELYPVEAVSDVIKECIDIGAYHKNSVKRLLSLMEIQPTVSESMFNIRTFEPVDIKRGLSEYKVEVCNE